MVHFSLCYVSIAQVWFYRNQFDFISLLSSFTNNCCGFCQRRWSTPSANPGFSKKWVSCVCCVWHLKLLAADFTNETHLSNARKSAGKPKISDCGHWGWGLSMIDDVILQKTELEQVNCAASVAMAMYTHQKWISVVTLESQTLTLKLPQ